jgi:hypothetical protein
VEVGDKNRNMEKITAIVMHRKPCFCVVAGDYPPGSLDDQAGHLDRQCSVGNAQSAMETNVRNSRAIGEPTVPAGILDRPDIAHRRRPLLAAGASGKFTAR